MRTSITRGSLRLGRSVDQSFHGPWGESSRDRRYPWRVTADEGYFGPQSVSWQVHREVTVLFGGARAMLMQAAHPLVIAGANQTGMYERNPWKRLQRTLVLQYALTFGTKAEAHAAADRINEVHERINGVDPVTGQRYDALDPELLLWVHACLVESALLFERLTVGALDDRGRQRFHEEQMLAAELVRLPREPDPADGAGARGLRRRYRSLGRARRHGRRPERRGALPRSAAGRGVAAGASDGGSPRLRDACRRSCATGTASPCGPENGRRGRATFAAAARLPAAAPGAGSASSPPINSGVAGSEGGGAGRGRDRAAARSGSACDGTLPIVTIDGLLLDIDGVLAVSWEALPGAVDALQRLRDAGVPFRLITNTTTKTRADLAATLRDAGFDVSDEEIVTAVVATADHLRAAHPGARVFVLSDGDATADLAGIDLADVDDADVIVIGGACDDFTYATMNKIFRRLMDGAALVGMHRNLFWKTAEGWELDGGAYLAGLEEAADIRRRRSAGSRRRPTSMRHSRCSVWPPTERRWSATTS